MKRLRCSRRGGWVLAVAFLAVGPGFAGERTLRQNVEILKEVEKDPGLASLPSIAIDTLQSNVPLDDRMNADEAFDRPFVEALKEGMTWYLQQRGLRVVDQGADLRLVGLIDSYEGWRGWGHWGAEITLKTKLFRGQELVLAEALHTLLKYPDEEDVEDEERPKYKARGAEPARFLEILFTRVGVDLSEKLIDTLKERAPGLDKAGAPPVAPAGVRGVINVDASASNAEVFIDGTLVGTVPLKDLALPAGSHTLEVRKDGFRGWKRDIRVLDGGASTFFAEMPRESPQ